MDVNNSGNKSEKYIDLYAQSSGGQNNFNSVNVYDKSKYYNSLSKNIYIIFNDI